MSSARPRPRPQRILIIGGGPCGLVTLRNLTERATFEHVELVERRDDVGGVWYLDPPIDPTDTRPRWPSPSYPGLRGNVLPEFLSFTHAPFPHPPPPNPFPTLIETHQYLRTFAAPLIARGLVRLRTEVVRVEELDGAGWRVVLRDWSDVGHGREVHEVWDAVVVATAYYDTPVYPDTPGLEDARVAGLVTHAKWYRGPAGFEGKRVLVVGNANSSNDMAAQLAPLVRTPVFRAIRRPPVLRFPALPDPRIHDVAPLAHIAMSGGKATATLQDGRVLPDLEAIFVGTGYRHDASFVRVLDLNSRDLHPLCAAETELARIPGLHRHILYARTPTLAFIGAIVSYTAFTLADVSSTWLALAWAGEVAYPDTVDDRLADERTRVETVRRLREAADHPSSLVSFHLLGKEEQAYAQALRADIVRVRKEYDDLLPRWDDASWRRREAMYAEKYDTLELA